MAQPKKTGGGEVREILPVPVQPEPAGVNLQPLLMYGLIAVAVYYLIKRWGKS